MGEPSTPEASLKDLSEAGYDDEKLEGMKDLIDAKDSDVFDGGVYGICLQTHTRD